MHISRNLGLFIMYKLKDAKSPQLSRYSSIYRVTILFKGASVFNVSKKLCGISGIARYLAILDIPCCMIAIMIMK